MLVSTKGRYALRLMTRIAKAGPGSKVSLREVSESEDISLKYLEQIARPLLQEGLIESVRGKGGGYRLTRTPQEYTVGEILELTEGSLAITACLQADAEICEKADTCMTLPMWKQFDRNGA